MEIENRLGGIVAADIVCIDEVASVEIADGYVVSLVLEPGAVWVSLPLAQLRSTVSPDVEDSDAGKLLHTEATLNLFRVTEPLKSYASLATVKGCLLRCFYASGDVVFYGTKEWPMHGSLVRVPGTTAADGHNYRLKLVSEVPYQGLQ
ncbi:MAG: hypothetical protein K6B45_04805 [Bacteroidaceae bacterium]|nr:hypothetical protein [Bacteroidaceae bacterium]